MENLNIIGASIEDAHLSAGLVNRQVLPNTLRRKRVNPKGSTEEILASWASVLKELLELNADKNPYIGIGLPNACLYDEGVFLGSDPERYRSFYNQNLNSLLVKALIFRLQISDY